MKQSLDNSRANREAFKRVLVTGGAGTIGSALVPLLLDQGCQVRVLDLLIYGSEALDHWLQHPGLELIQGDFRRADLVERALQGVDAVVHLGAIVADQACDLDPEITRQVNLLASRMIAEMAKRMGVRRFIFAGTASVYGASDALLDEDSIISPVTLYARTKAEAERELLMLADERFCPVSLRFSTVYGLSRRYRFDLVVNLLTAKAVVEGIITIHGGDQWRAFVHVQDVARGILAALEAPSPRVRGEVFNVGSDGQNYTIAQLGEIIQRLVPEAHIVTQAVADIQNYRVNFDKIHRQLGFTPRWSIEQGIQQVIDALRSGTIPDYKSANYNNFLFLSCGGLKLLKNL